MATVKLNGQTSPSNMLCFSDSINILEYSGSVSGVNAVIQMTFSGLTSGSTDYYLTILDETITSTDSASGATNKRFYVGDDNSTAYYVARALRCCDSLNADWNIVNSGNKVTMTAKTIGKKVSSGDVTSNMFAAASISGGSSTSLFGGMINVMVSDSSNSVELQKNISDNYTSFNLSPILASFAEYGKAKAFTTRLANVTNDGVYTELMSGVTNYVGYGYMCNESDPYLPIVDRILINPRCNYEDITYYTYGNSIPFSILYNGASAYTWSAKRSDLTVISSSTTTFSAPSNKIADLTCYIPSTYMINCYYIDITYGLSTIRYHVIKPIKMTDSNTRVLWRNEYGGISFFDFTAASSATYSISNDTYNKNVYDYYRTYDKEYKVPYKTLDSREVKLASHILEKGGRFLANSLAASKRVWIEKNGEKHYLVTKSVEMAEVDQYKNLYQFNYTFEYSL